MKKLTYLFVIFCTCYSLESYSQNYNTGIGIRLGGFSNGLTVKHFIKEDAAIEGILSGGFPYRGFHVTVLYEKHLPAFKSDQILFFYGAGGHLGYYRAGMYEGWWKGKRYYYGESVMSGGIDGIIGLEWLIPGIPFTLGADIKPTIELFNPLFDYLDGGISFRYKF